MKDEKKIEKGCKILRNRFEISRKDASFNEKKQNIIKRCEIILKDAVNFLVIPLFLKNIPTPLRHQENFHTFFLFTNKFSYV